MSPSAQLARRRRNAVHDFLVHRRAQRRGKPAIALERRLRAAVAHQALGQPVEVRRRDARRHRRFEFREHLAPRTGWPPASSRSRRPIGRRSSRASHAPTRPPRRCRPPPRPASGRRQRIETSAAPRRTRRAAAVSRAYTRRRSRTTSTLSSRRCTSAPPHLRARRQAGDRIPPARAANPPQRSAARSASPPGTSMFTTTIGGPSCGQRVERLGLRPRVRGNPSRTKPADGVGPQEPFPDDADHDVVADQLARVHDGLARASELRPGLHGLPQDVAGRDPRHDARSREKRSACVPLPAPGAPNITSRTGTAARPYPRRPRMRVFFMKPS